MITFSTQNVRKILDSISFLQKTAFLQLGHITYETCGAGSRCRRFQKLSNTLNNKSSMRMQLSGLKSCYIDMFADI